MHRKLPAISNPPARPSSTDLRARGTKTSLIDDRRIRLHSVGDRPWERDPNNHRDRVNVEEHGGTFVVFKPSTGALSALRPHEYLCFHVFLAANGDVEALTRYLVQEGEVEAVAARRAKAFADRFMREGWMRRELPRTEEAPLRGVYLTVTRWCDRTCPYCYQGLENRAGTEMTLDQVRLALDRIKVVHDKCRIVVSGGEPLSHSRIREILELIDGYGFPIGIVSNGSYLDEKAADHLQSLKGLRAVQLSIDGITAEGHEFTRGKGHFVKVMAALNNLIERKLPFTLAPTLHRKNLHELPALAELAMSNGGWISPNSLMELPHAGLNYTDLTLSTEAMLEALGEANQHVVRVLGEARARRVRAHYDRADPEGCSAAPTNSQFVCGMGYSLADIDWNGDVYPCHVLKGPELVIGNLFREDFASIFKRVEERGIRVKSSEIEKCSGCKFVSTCGGGCRASAWFNFGTLEHEGEGCEVICGHKLRQLLAGRRPS